MIKIERTKRTPEIHFNPEAGTLEMTGRSIPENSIEFYESLIQQIVDYTLNPQERTELRIRLDYFNTASSKSLLEIFKKFEQVYKQGKEVHIYWFYDEDDEDMLDAGEDYQAIVKVPFQIEAIERP